MNVTQRWVSASGLGTSDEFVNVVISGANDSRTQVAISYLAGQNVVSSLTGWTLRGSYYNATDNISAAVFTRNVGTAADETVTVNFTNNGYKNAVVLELDALYDFGDIDFGTYNNTSVPTYTSPGVAYALDDGGAIGILFANRDHWSTGLTATTGYTVDFYHAEGSAVTRPNIGVAHKTITAAGTYDVTFTTTDSGSEGLAAILLLTPPVPSITLDSATKNWGDTVTVTTVDITDPIESFVLAGADSSDPQVVLSFTGTGPYTVQLPDLDSITTDHEGMPFDSVAQIIAFDGTNFVAADITVNIASGKQIMTFGDDIPSTVIDGYIQYNWDITDGSVVTGCQIYCDDTVTFYGTGGIFSTDAAFSFLFYDSINGLWRYGEFLDPGVPNILFTGELLSAHPEYLSRGDTYTSSLALVNITSTDVVDGDLTSSVTVDLSALDTAVNGTYTITYSVTDSDENVTTENRTVYVYEDVSPVASADYQNLSYQVGDVVSEDLSAIWTDYTGNGMTFTLTSGSLPPGLSVSSAGLLSGTTTTAGIYSDILITADNGIGPSSTQNTFSISVTAVDTTPDAFDLGTDVTNAIISTYYQATRVTIAGITPAAVVTVTPSNGQISVNGGAWSSSPASATLGTTVDFRVMSSSSYSTTVVGTLTINSVSDTYSVTTRAAPDTTAPVVTLLGSNPLNLDYGEVYVEPGYTAVDAVDGDVTADVNVTGSVNSSVAGTYALAYSVSDTAGNIGSAIRTVIVAPQVVIDETADAFSFAAQTDAVRGQSYTSAAITVAGLGTGVSVSASVTNGQMIVNGGSPASSATVSNGDTIALQVTASANYATAITATLDINGVTGNYVVTTLDQPAITQLSTIPAQTLNDSSTVNLDVAPYFNAEVESFTLIGQTSGLTLSGSTISGLLSEGVYRVAVVAHIGSASLTSNVIVITVTETALAAISGEPIEAEIQLLPAKNDGVDNAIYKNNSNAVFIPYIIGEISRADISSPSVSCDVTQTDGTAIETLTFTSTAKGRFANIAEDSAIHTFDEVILKVRIIAGGEEGQWDMTVPVIERVR